MRRQDRTGTLADVQTSQAMLNLRGIFVVILVSFHSCLPYLASTPPLAADLDVAPYSWLAFPVVDSHRFFGFDIYCAWEDVHVMAMMFFLSGVFVPASLARKGPGRFALDRALRLGAPFVFGVLFLTPLAIYPVYLQMHPGAPVADYLAAYVRLPFLPNGPQWFLWVLLVWSLAAAALEALKPGALAALVPHIGDPRRRPARFLVALGAAAALAYVPLTLRYGPFDWYVRGPFSFQLSRPLLYGVYFFAGAAIGGSPLGAGLLAPDGELARRWKRLAALAPAALFLWMGLTGVTIGYPDFAPGLMRLLSALAYVGASVAGVTILLAVSIRFCTKPIRWLAPLGVNGLGIFVVHYAPMTWTQYALLGVDLPGVVKAGLVFAVTLAASFATAFVMRCTPGLSLLTGRAPTATLAQMPQRVG